MSLSPELAARVDACFARLDARPDPTPTVSAIQPGGPGTPARCLGCGHVDVYPGDASRECIVCDSCGAEMHRDVLTGRRVVKKAPESDKERGGVPHDSAAARAFVLLAGPRGK